MSNDPECQQSGARQCVSTKHKHSYYTMIKFVLFSSSLYSYKLDSTVPNNPNLNSSSAFSVTYCNQEGWAARNDKQTGEIQIIKKKTC